MDIVIPVLGFGRTGGYRVLSELASAWKQLGHRVVFLSPQCSAQPYFPTTAEIIWLDDHGARAARVDAVRAGPAGVTLNLLCLLRGLNAHARDADIVLANHSLTAWPTAVSRTKAKRFYYVQAYETEYFAGRRGLNARVLEAAATLSYLLPLRRVANSPIYTSYKFLRTKAWVPPAVDENLFRPRTSFPSFGPDLTLGCIGRTEPEKGIRYVVEAFELLRAQGLPVRLRVAFGNIPEEKVRLPGCEVVIPNSDAELAEFYRSVDVLVAPGLVQLGAPHYPVMEAMACGTPVVTTGYLPADRNNAWIVPVADSGAIANAVIEIQQNPELAESRRQRGIVSMARFTWPEVAQQMMTLFLQDW